MPKFLFLLLAGLALNCTWASELTIEETDRCDVCGMGIKKFPGPKAILEMRGGHQLKFCSAREAYCYALKPENQMLVDKMYVHDMGRSDWNKPDDSTFIDGKKAFMVLGAKKRAIMGPPVATFENEGDALKFAHEFGGEVYEFSDLSSEFLQCSRRAHF